MTIHERMIPRTEREKDLLKYGRSQERERIIKLLEDLYLKRDADGNVLDTKHNEDLLYVIALIKGEEQ